jgi:hypothetical protein
MTTKITSLRELKESQLTVLLLDQVGGKNMSHEAFAAALKYAVEYGEECGDIDDLGSIANFASNYYEGYKDALEAKK